MGSFLKYKTKKKTYKVLPRETRTKGDICKTLLTFNNEYTHTHTHNTPHARTTHIFVQQKCSKDLSGVCVWMFFFSLHSLYNTMTTTTTTTTSVRRREGPIVAPIYMSAQYRHSQLPGRIAKSQEGHIYTSPSRPTMTPWK